MLSLIGLSLMSQLLRIETDEAELRILLAGIPPRSKAVLDGLPLYLRESLGLGEVRSLPINFISLRTLLARTPLDYMYYPPKTAFIYSWSLSSKTGMRRSSLRL